MPAPRWDGPLYAANTAHHRAFDDAVLAGLALATDSRIVDIGCGAGDLTARLADRTPNGLVVGLEPDPDLLSIAERRRVGRASLRVVRGRAQDLGAVLVGPLAPPYDVVSSVATLHWIPAADHARVLAGVRLALRPGGCFRAEFGGSGQLADLRALLDERSVALGGPISPWFFPTVPHYRDLLDAAGLVATPPGFVRLVAQRRSMPDAAALLGWLRSQVLVAYTAAMSAARAQEFRAMVEPLALRQNRRADGSYDQDYLRLDLLAVRPM